MAGVEPPRKIEVQSFPLRIRIDFKPDRRGGEMTPQEFIAKWKPVNLSERSAAQQHFLDLCDLLGQPKPAAADPEGVRYCFEKGVRKTGGGKGWADVWLKGHFGWEYKGKHNKKN